MANRLLISLGIGGICLGAAVLAGLTFPTDRPGTALFVAAKGSIPTLSGDMLWSSDLPDRPTGDFLVHKGKLYLKVETIYHHFLDDSVGFADWTPERLTLLLRLHPEVAPYMPDSQKPDCGITWLKAWGRK